MKNIEHWMWPQMDKYEPQHVGYNMKSVFVYIEIIFDIYDSVYYVNCFSGKYGAFSNNFVFYAICKMYFQESLTKTATKTT